MANPSHRPRGTSATINIASMGPQIGTNKSHLGPPTGRHGHVTGDIYIGEPINSPLYRHTWLFQDTGQPKVSNAQSAILKEQ